ncbi:MAG TPA: CRTAC1 family protein [Planctomycetota bacterium]|nr:CRTAC1 family protein [Planctomycetota bacterium]
MSAPPHSERRMAQRGVTLLFGGLLATVCWLDRRPQSLVAAPDATVGFRLTEVAASAGLDFVHHPMRLDPRLANVEPHVAAMGAAVSVSDVNNDGWPDLFVTNSDFGQPNALFLNQADAREGRTGTFRDIAAGAGLAECNREGEGVSTSGVWGDYDNDGFEDLYVVKWGYGQLFRNNGDLTFTDVTARAGLRRWMNANSAVWFDYDRDGLLDLYVAGYFPEVFDLWHVTTTKIMQESFEFARNGGHNTLWRNLGDGRFEDVTAATGCDSTRWTLAVAAADFDGDGWQDLYLANDYGPEELFLNVEGRRFELASVGLGEDSKSGMSVAVGDVHNQGRLDVYVTNISENRYLFQGNNLRLNLLAEAGRFENVAESVVADTGWAWGAQFGDLDNDGRQDLYVVNGFISADRTRDYWYDMSVISGGNSHLFQDAANWKPIGDASLSGYQRSRLLLNRGAGHWTDVAAAVGADDLYDGRAVALVDLWNRGALDVVIANQKGPLLVYRNDVDPARAWISFRLIGTASNRSAIGAQVTLHFGGQVQCRVVDGGSGFASQNDRRLHFGLGAGQADRAVIRWPSGREQVLESPASRSLITVTEPAP